MRSSLGFSTVELLVALTVFSLECTAVIVLAGTSQALVSSGQFETNAVNLAEEQLQEAVIAGQQDFSAVASRIESVGPYQVAITVVTKPDLVTKLVTIHVTSNAQHSIEASLSAFITDYQEPNDGQTCDSTPRGDWTRPHISNATTDLAQLIGDNNTYPITDVDAYHGKLYLAVNNSSVNQSTFFVFDVSDPSHPVLLSKLDNDPEHNTGLNAVTVSGDTAYVASASSFTAGQLQLIDLRSSPPVVITTYKVPGVTGSSTQGIGESITYRDGYVYLGLTKPTSGPDFNIIDVHDPSHPLWVGGYRVGNTINDVLVSGDDAYLATPNSQELKILNISDPTNPVLVGGFDAPDSVGHGKSLALTSDTLYLGRTVTASNHELYALSNSSPAASLPILGSYEVGSSVNGLIAQGSLVFALTAHEFRVLDVSDLTQIHDVASLSLPASGSATEPSMDCEGNVFFVTANDSHDRGTLSVVTAP